MEKEVATGESRPSAVPVEAARGPGPDGHFFTLINSVTVKFKEPTSQGEHMLNKAELKPAGDFVLIQLLGHSTRSVGLDETVDLRGAGTEEFRAFKSDRIFRFTLNGHGFEWGADKMAEPELRAVAHVHPDEVIVLERDGADIDLGPEDVLDLGNAGTEHLHAEKRLITVKFENVAREIPRGTYTTEQLKKLFGVQDGYTLEYINHEGRLTALKEGKKLRVKDGMQFFEQVPCGASS